LGQVLSFQQYTLDVFTNHTFVVYPVTCPTNPTTLFQGIERMRFVRRDFDSLIGQFFTPVTNIYTLNEITNGMLIPRTIERVITAPDITFAASDLYPGSAVFPVRGFPVFRTINFNMNNIPPNPNGASGPGTIETPSRIVFSKVGALFINFRFDPERFLDELTSVRDFIWGTFDATTNAPIVYPNGTSLNNLINQTLMTINPPFVPMGRVGVPFSQQVSTSGGTPPYTWSLAPGSHPLPPGLNLTSDGTISGTPTASGTYDFTLRVVDGSGRTVDYPYSITISP